MLKALLARACIPLCFIQTLKFESGQILPSDVVFLYVLMMFSTVWICDLIYIDKRVNRGIVSCISGGTTFIGCMSFAFVMTHVIFQTGAEARKYLLIDYGFPVLSFNQLLSWTSHELWNLAFFIYSYLTAIGVGPVRLLSWLLYLSFHATVVFYIVYVLFTLIYAETHYLLYDNFLYTFDINTTGAYPKGYLDPLHMDKGLYDKASMTTDTFSCSSGFTSSCFPIGHKDGLYVKASLTTDTYSCSPSFVRSCFLTGRKEEVENFDYPYNHKVIYRYLGEDVKMICKFAVTTSNLDLAKVNPPAWYLNNSVVQNYSRYTIHNTYNPIGESVNVFSTLTIKFLREYDFGEYICSRPVTRTNYKINDQGGIDEEQTIRRPTLNVFFLHQIKTQPKLIYRFVGNLIASETFFLYNSDDDINDMSIIYSINDKPVDEVCPGFQTHICSIGASLLQTLISLAKQSFDWDGMTVFPFVDIAEIPSFSFKRGIIYYCLCSNGYGIHRVSFLRNVNRAAWKRQRSEEIVHPFTIILLPQSQQSLFRFHDDVHLYKKIEKLIQDEASINIIENEVKDIIEFVKSNEEKVFTEANVIQALLFVCCGITFYTLTLGVSHLYMVLLIRYFPRMVFLPQLESAEVEPLLAIEQYVYDVFFSFAEEEDSFVTEELVPFLEDECRLRTCFSRRDFPQNKSIFSSYVENIQRSRKVIVILSDSYIREATCVRLQLEHIIMPSLYEHMRDQRNILILRYDTTPVPDLLRWNFQIEVLKWYEQLPTRVKQRSLKKWVFFRHT